MKGRRVSSGRYWKFQSRYVMLPAAIEGFRGTDDVGVCIHPTRSPRQPPPAPAHIHLDPHEAIGFASWLNEQAEHILARHAKAAARKAAKAAKTKGI